MQGIMLEGDVKSVANLNRLVDIIQETHGEQFSILCQ